MRDVWMSIILLLLRVMDAVLPLVAIDLLDGLLDSSYIDHRLLLFRVS